METNGNEATELACEQFETLTVILVTFLIFIIGLQTVIIILILLCSLKMIKTARHPKINRNIQESGLYENNDEFSPNDIIEKQPKLSDTIMQKDNPEANPMYMVMN